MAIVERIRIGSFANMSRANMNRANMNRANIVGYSQQL